MAGLIGTELPPQKYGPTKIMATDSFFGKNWAFLCLQAYGL